jgi:Mce-associated membrane protein
MTTTLDESELTEVEPVEAEADEVDGVDEASDPKDTEEPARKVSWPRVLAYGVLPGIALVLALVLGYLKWNDQSANDFAQARSESVRVAGEDVVALLSYQPNSVDKDLSAARERLTGDFKKAYNALIHEVVIPGAKEKHIASVAKLSAAASVSATDQHAVVLVFVNQTVTIGGGAPTDTAPVVRVVLDKVEGRWLVSRFDPV